MIAIGLASSQLRELSLEEPVVFFDDDQNGGYYWFLHPLFGKLAEQTGQYIDLYGDAKFSGENIELLRKTLVQARQLVEKQPDRWCVYSGTAMMPNAGNSPLPREIFKSVDRSVFLSMLDSLLEIIDRSVATGLPIVCLGD